VREAWEETASAVNDATLKIPYSFSASFVSRWLLRIIAGLVFLHLITQFGKYRFGLVRGVRLFYLDSENAIPAYFSALQLLGASILLAVIAQEHGRQLTAHARHWWPLAVGFCFMSFDEACAIHEHVRSLGLEKAMHVTANGYFYFPWVVCGVFVSTLVGALFIPFLARLTAVTRWRFIVAGTVFLGGTLGMEMVGAKYASTHGTENPGFVTCVTIEETLEMVGVALFIRALLLYIEATFGTCALGFGRERQALED
jgi:hypothetical protein